MIYVNHVKAQLNAENAENAEKKRRKHEILGGRANLVVKERKTGRNTHVSHSDIIISYVSRAGIGRFKAGVVILVNARTKIYNLGSPVCGPVAQLDRASAS